MRAFAFAAVLLLSACATPPPPDGPLPPPGRLMGKSVTEAQDGSTVALAVGERLSVELVGIASAGYVWELVEAPPFLAEADVLSGPTHARQRQPGFAGGNNWDVHLFRAEAAGEGTLTLHLRRPWETNEPPSRTFSVKVVVR